MFKAHLYKYVEVIRKKYNVAKLRNFNCRSWHTTLSEIVQCSPVSTFNSRTIVHYDTNWFSVNGRGVIYLPGHVEYQASKQAENESRINISIDRYIYTKILSLRIPTLITDICSTQIKVVITSLASRCI